MTEQLQSWRVATTAAGAFTGEPPGPDELEWRSETLPVQGADDEDHWFRHTFDAAGPAPTLRFDGLATVCDVFLDGALVLQSESMFLAHSLPVRGRTA